MAILSSFTNQYDEVGLLEIANLSNKINKYKTGQQLMTCKQSQLKLDKKTKSTKCFKKTE